MEFIIGSKIIVKNPTADLVQWCEETLVMPNPEYEKKVRLGKWVGNTPKKFSLYERDGDMLRLPFGCLLELERRYRSAAIYKGALKSPQPFRYDSYICLYPYQEEAVQAALKYKNGIIVMPCGAGKTQTGLEIIARLGVKALWLTHTKDLLKQSLNRAKSVFGADSSSYGTITEGRVDIGSSITFATVQTMCMINLPEYKDEWGVVIVDECHKAIGGPTKMMQFYKVLSALACRHKYGLTATPERADGLEKSMFALIGDVIHEVPRSAVSSTTCPVVVDFIKTGYMPDMNAVLNGDGTLNYAGLVEDMTTNDARMDFVVEQCIDAVCAGATLILANRVQYLERMCERLKKKGLRCVCLSSLGQSVRAKKVRENALNQLNTGELDCILATYKLAKEGLDIPQLRYLVMATPEKDPTTIKQSAGRVGRKAKGKSHGTVIDFVDEFGMYKGWWKKRLSIYKKLGYVII